MTEAYRVNRMGAGPVSGGPVLRMFAVIDEMITDGRLVYDPNLGVIDIGAWPKKGHRPRPSLLRQAGYVAWRQRAEDRLSPKDGGVW
ncbi:hypothetical protein KQR54_00595 [Mycobacterium gordonae]|uniref:hypothetical protein n=1 Tax=Mycobacterium gordonae TaxID=1778 RepID=UPI00210B195F|nr:hypothetical protein [Mycobacterium gordonae]MCQ4359662.1 hypothetical protein [Mycobacterium gordonae]